MNIIAVIPARAGSVGIPNKNIRIVSDRPLISYVIDNAIHSKYISKVIVISDSEEIEVIASQYDVVFKKENDELCLDNVTLDEVVYYALHDEIYDYAVTLQPTSPTLKVKTLDDAIEYAIGNDFDTVLSAVNKPKLGWIVKDGRLAPDYEKRLNRQYMPEHYMETGGFVICKCDVLFNKTRFGANVSIFEVSEDESIDIDSYNDLICAENILNKKTTAIVVNGNNSIGMGHIYRMLDLADMFYSKPVFYYDKNLTEKSAFGSTTYEVRPFSTQEELLSALETGNYSMVINDILDTDCDYISKIKGLASKPKVISFEDKGSGSGLADLVINALYGSRKSNPPVYSGNGYYIVPKLFTFFDSIKVREDIKSVFICFGGADPRKYTEALISIAQQEKYNRLTFHIVIGRAKKNAEELLSLSKENLNLYYDVKSMPQIMSQCDVGVTSRGRTCYELAYLGIPTLSIAQNETEMMHDFVDENNGFLTLDYHSDFECIKTYVDRLVNLSYEQRENMHCKMKKTDLSKGRKRVRDLILDL